MVMEFEEFSRQFRARTPQRMIEFEKALAKAQERVEKSTAAPTPRTRSTTPAQAPGGHTPALRPGARGQVQGVLRRN